MYSSKQPAPLQQETLKVLYRAATHLSKRCFKLTKES